MIAVISSRDAGQHPRRNGYATISKMKRNNSLDTGFLSLFRLFIGIRLIAAFLGLLALYERTEPQPRHGSNFLWLEIAELAFLMGYLSWPWLQRRLGKVYLPVALGIAVIGPVVENFLSIELGQPGEVLLARTASSEWQSVIVLLVPVILISWKYGYRAAAASSLGLAILDSLLFLSFPRPFPFRDRPLPFLGIIVFRTLTFLLISYVIVRLSSELRRQNIELEQANRQLISFTATSEKLAISRERNRLARELHDTLAHSLSAVAVQLEAAKSLWESDQKQAQTMLEHSLILTRNGLNEARRAIQALRTAPLEDLGLGLALKNLATSTVERVGLALDFLIPPDPPALPPDVEYALYRIAEEALINVTQHAGAKSVSLHLDREDQHLVMTIHDDGSGFDINQVSDQEGYGLRGMRERAEAIGGHLEIESRLGQGTTVRLVLEESHDSSIDL